MLQSLHPKKKKLLVNTAVFFLSFFSHPKFLIAHLALKDQLFSDFTVHVDHLRSLLNVGAVSEDGGGTKVLHV